MSEDLQIDAVVYPSMIKESIENDQTTEPNPFRLNYTRIKELQDIKQMKNGTNSYRHQFSPRIVFKALNEIKGPNTGLYDKYGGEEEFRKSFVDGLPKVEDVYG